MLLLPSTYKQPPSYNNSTDESYTPPLFLSSVQLSPIKRQTSRFSTTRFYKSPSGTWQIFRQTCLDGIQIHAAILKLMIYGGRTAKFPSCWKISFKMVAGLLMVISFCKMTNNKPANNWENY